MYTELVLLLSFMVSLRLWSRFGGGQMSAMAILKGADVRGKCPQFFRGRLDTSRRRSGGGERIDRRLLTLFAASAVAAAAAAAAAAAGHHRHHRCRGVVMRLDSARSSWHCDDAMRCRSKAVATGGTLWRDSLAVQCTQYDHLVLRFEACRQKKAQ